MDALSEHELRVLGCLLEKAVTTPDQYPLTLNAIINACNQKSAREPVMNLEQGQVQRALRLLEDKLLVSNDPNLKGRVEKYMQRFCKPPFGVFDFDDAQYAVLTVLMLRGAATPGELRTRTDRLHKFADNTAVLETLAQLSAWDPDPLVCELPREPNRRDSTWMHLFGEEPPKGLAQPAVTTRQTERSVDVNNLATDSVPTQRQQPAAAENKNPAQSDAARITALEARVDAVEKALEAALARLG